jgi:hypothetical protein
MRLKSPLLRPEVNTHLINLPGGAERQHGHAHHEISNGERHDKQVGDTPQLRAQIDGQNYQAVAHNDHHIQKAQGEKAGQQFGLVPIGNGAAGRTR